MWGYKEKGKLFLKGQQTIPYPIHKVGSIMFKHPRAATLYADLIACHKGIHERFAIGQKAYAKRSGWDEKTVRELINLLVNESLLKIVYKGGKHPGDANLYEFN